MLLFLFLILQKNLLFDTLKLSVSRRNYITIMLGKQYKIRLINDIMRQSFSKYIIYINMRN